MYRAVLLLFATGCGTEAMKSAAPMVDAAAPGPTFAHDTFYTGIVPPYPTPEACEVSDPNPIECHLELGFCAGGVAGFSNFDLPLQGTYYLDGENVIATFPISQSGSGAQTIELDTATGSATNAEVDTYILDTAGRWGTLQFDVGIDCPDAS